MSVQTALTLVFIMFIGVGLYFGYLWLSYQSQKTAHTQEVTQNRGVIIKSFQIGHPYTNQYKQPAYHNNSFASGSSDSAGGWSLSVKILNCNKKRIKYCTFNVYTVDAVGGPAICEIAHTANFSLRGTGPVLYGEYGSWLFETFCYSHNLANCRVNSLYIEYADGSNETISGNSINWGK